MSTFPKTIAEKVIGGVSVKKHCFLLTRNVQASQRAIALIAEMIHTASLVHDDVIDDASSRRGKHTVNKIWGEKKVRAAFWFFSSFILNATLFGLHLFFRFVSNDENVFHQMWSSSFQNSFLYIVFIDIQMFDCR